MASPNPNPNRNPNPNNPNNPDISQPHIPTTTNPNNPPISQPHIPTTNISQMGQDLYRPPAFGHNAGFTYPLAGNITSPQLLNFQIPAPPSFNFSPAGNTTLPQFGNLSIPTSGHQQLNSGVTIPAGNTISDQIGSSVSDLIPGYNPRHRHANTLFNAWKEERSGLTLRIDAVTRRMEENKRELDKIEKEWAKETEMYTREAMESKKRKRAAGEGSSRDGGSDDHQLPKVFSVDSMCIRCKVQPANVIWFPCRHFYVCVECDKNEQETCLVCGTKKKGFVVVEDVPSLGYPHK